MSYQTGEAQILALIRTYVGNGNTWTAANSISIANDASRIADGLANSGHDYHYLFLQPGQFSRRRDDIALSVVVTRWITHISLMALAGAKTTPMKTLAEDREAITAVLDKYYRLDDTANILDTFVASGAVVQQRTFGTARGKQQFLFVQQILQVEWEEESRVTQSD